MKYSFILFSVILFFSPQSHSQNRVVISDIYIKLNGGTSSSPICLVVENNQANGITNLTPCGTPCIGTSGIISESEFNIVQWKQSNVPTTYLIPFSKGVSDYMPFTFSLVTPALPLTTSLQYSTEPVSSTNLPLPSDVTNLTICPGDALNMVDRFWHIGDNGATTRPEGVLEFTYLPSEYNAPNLITEANLGAQRFNTVTNVWTDLNALGNSTGLNMTSKTIQTPIVNNVNLFRTWTLDMIDNTPPVISCPNSINTCDPLVTYSLPTATDNCMVSGITQTDITGLSSGSNFPIGLSTIEYTAIDISGNTSVCTIDVVVNPLPIIDAGMDQSVCEGTTITLSASGALTYSWDNGVIDNSAFIPPLGITTYTVTGTDINGCVNTDQVTISVVLTSLINASTDTSICIGSTVELTATGGTNYFWDNNLGTGNSFFVSPSITTTYTVTGTDINGCIGTDETTITIYPNPVISAGENLIISESDLITLIGSGATSYTWDNGVLNGVGFTQPISTIMYTVIGMDTNGCVDTAQIIVTTIPTAFTPDNDNINDTWELSGLDTIFPNNVVYIYNRWGSLVFQSEKGKYESNRWDGTFNGKELPVGSYYFIIDYNDSKNRMVKGTVTIILKE